MRQSRLQLVLLVASQIEFRDKPRLFHQAKDITSIILHIFMGRKNTITSAQDLRNAIISIL